MRPLKPKRKRLTFVFIGMLLLASAAALFLTAISENIVYFHSPSDIVKMDVAPDRRIRIGGLVEEGSVEKDNANAIVRFRVTDLVNAVPVIFKDELPDLFREGQGVVANGRFQDGVFMAEEVLAKHDENYMPPEAAEALKRSGQWKEFKKSLDESGQLTKGAKP